MDFQVGKDQKLIINLVWPNEATMKSNFVLWAVILLVAKVASTWANHTEGSAGQKGGSLRLMLVAATTGVSATGWFVR